jgi:hypothetical protein
MNFPQTCTVSAENNLYAHHSNILSVKLFKSSLTFKISKSTELAVFNSHGSQVQSRDDTIYHPLSLLTPTQNAGKLLVQSKLASSQNVDSSYKWCSVSCTESSHYLVSPKGT